MIKTFMQVVFLLLVSKTISAQPPYRNEWIDYGKTYYKFRIGSFGNGSQGPIKNGLVRIPQSTLAAAGLGNVSADQFQLWTNGVQVPVYISKTTGILSSSDYIEFWGEMSNGRLDNELYNDSNSQINDGWCMSTDSSAYFLTVSSPGDGNNLRLVSTVNDVQNASIDAEKNFLYSTGTWPRSILYAGFSVSYDGFPLYLSTYDPGEGYTSRGVFPNSCGCINKQLQLLYPALYADTSVACTLKVNMVGTSSNNRNVRIWLNNDSVAKVAMGYFNYSKTTVNNLSGSRIKNDTANIIIENLGTESTNGMVVGRVEFSYGRRFNFDGASSFEFNIAASGQGRYLKITNFSSGTGSPVLYDLTNGKRYVADMVSPDTLRFLLQPSTEDYRLVLVRNDGSTAKAVTSLQQKKYINYGVASNQGDYFIITNSLLLGDDTSNYAEQYRKYRSSAAGGKYKAKLALIDDLEDQFAWGLRKHPQAIRNFLRYARNNFTTAPAYAFIIGKGVSYQQYRINGEGGTSDKLNLVQTFGNPGSDNLLASNPNTDYAATSIGRLSAVSPQEVGIYLNKVKEYEKAQRNKNDGIENKDWMKNVLHITGADDKSLSPVLDTMMVRYGKTISDTLFGGNVNFFSKSGDSVNYANSVVNFESIFNEGSALVTYFGHSSSSSLNFSFDDPANYSNTGRYPFFIANGCLAGNIFNYDAQRQSILTTLSEKYVLAPKSGSIAYLATSSFGVVGYLDIYTQKFYNNMSYENYGKGLGDIIRNGIYEGLKTTGMTDFYGRMHAHQYNLNGDPALRMNSFSKPDYAIESGTVNVPSFISAAADSFRIKVKIYNIGEATSDSVRFALYRLSKNNTDSTLEFIQKFGPIYSSDSVFVTLSVVPNRDTGLITYSAIIDDNKKINEISEKNNRATFSTNISTKELKPVYPYNYAIINTNKIAITASTAYALEARKRYWLEIDTSALFNSPGKVRLSKASKGGVIEFPEQTLLYNNTTYYWRTAAAGAKPLWQSFSFTYRKDSTPGYSQNHFYQHTESSATSIYDDTAGRSWKFGAAEANISVKQAVYPTSGTEDYDFSAAVNGTTLGVSACVGSSIIFHVLDPNTMKPIPNTTNPYGAAAPCTDLRLNNFEFSTQTAAARKNAMDFLDNFVSNGYFVVVRKIYDLGDADWAPTVWAKDTSVYGSGNSLYHRLKAQGLMIDSFVYPRTFIMVYKKNDSTNFKPVSVFSKGIYDQVVYSGNALTVSNTAYVNSPLFGPVKNWQKVSWNGNNINTNNSADMQVVAYDQEGRDSVFYTLAKNTSQDISGIDAEEYPYLQLQMKTVDTVSAIPYQLQEWKITGKFAPEGAMAPNLGISIPAKLDFDHGTNLQYDSLSGYAVFKNISNTAFTAIKVKISIADSSGKIYNFPAQATRALPAGDTVQIRFLINVKSLPAGTYNFIMEVNPDNNQPEQYHFNNFLYKDLLINRPASVQNVSIVAEDKSTALSSVFPNPFTDKLIITNKSNNASVAKLYSISGQLVMQQTFTGKAVMNTSSLAAGTYMLEIITGSNKETFILKK